MARLQATSLPFKIAMEATLEATHRAIVETAKREHAKIMAADPRPGGFRRFVDGVEGAKEEAVKPTGVIQYDYQRLELAAQVAMETLFDLSPVLTGEYRNSHTLFLNDVAVPNLKDWKPGDLVTISNFVPYARKIEVGKMKMRVSGTAEVYSQAERIVKRRYGNLANIKFTFRGIVGGAIASGKAHGKSEYRYPALMISERG